ACAFPDVRARRAQLEQALAADVEWISTLDRSPQRRLGLGEPAQAVSHDADDAKLRRLLRGRSRYRREAAPLPEIERLRLGVHLARVARDLEQRAYDVGAAPEAALPQPIGNDDDRLGIRRVVSPREPDTEREPRP